MRNTMTYTHQSQFLEMFGNPMTDSDSAPKLSDNVTLVLGSTPNSKTEKYWNGSLPWITPAELTDNSFEVSDTERRITEEGADSANLTEMPVGTVLFSTRAPIGKTAITTAPMYCNQGFKNMICGEKINNVFLYYTLKLNKEYLQSLGTGTTFKELSKAVIEKLHLEIPPMELQTQFETIYRQADKSKFDGFKSQFLEMTIKESVGTKQLHEIATYSIGLTYSPNDISTDGIPVLRSGNIQNGQIDLTDLVRVNKIIKDEIIIRDGDILMCSRNGSASLVGKTAICRNLRESTTFGAFMTIVRSDFPEYLNAFFSTQSFRKQISFGKSTTMNQITQKMLDGISIPDVSDESKIKFASIVRQADKSKYYELN